MENLTKIQNALKDFYLPAFRVQVNENVSPFYDKMKKVKEGVVGKQIVMALRHGRNGGFASITDDADLPTPNARKTSQAKWETKNLFGRMQITEKAIRASKDSKGAFASMLETSMEDLLTDAKENLNRQIFMDGSSKLATTDAVTAVAVVGVDSVQYIAEGMLIDILDNTGAPKYTGLEVIMVDDSANEITVSQVVTTVGTDIVTVTRSYNNEITGLEAIFEQNSTLYGIDRATNKWFNANEETSVGALSFVKMQKAFDVPNIKMGSNVDFIMTSHGVNRSYLNLLHANKRYNNTMKLEGGHREYLEFNGSPVIPDRYVKAGDMYYLDSSNFKMYTMADWDFMNRDGAVLNRVSGKAAYEATLFNFCDMGCDKPGGQYRLRGVTES